ncbi:hypothetical protein [uncultured Alistipes sp.]|jgi:hypothetical protein|uniref:hypothetical protein n=1 Tax=uncultured Alistipes sp. TaxID=538949 RepID=UPI0025CF768A|nr:hypothetical protein [uncultured Alistipes sp.]
MKTKNDDERGDELKEIFEQAQMLSHCVSVQSRVFAVIAAFYSCEDPDDDTRFRFVKWLTDGEYEREKTAAMFYIFDNEFAPGKTRIRRPMNLPALLAEGENVPPMTDYEDFEREMERISRHTPQKNSSGMS